MFKNLLYILILLTVLGFSVLGRNGLLELINFETQLSDLQTRLRNFKSETRKKSDTLYGINNNPGYLEKLAREELGLSKKGEIIYLFENKDSLEEKSCEKDQPCKP